ncbi:hypothetical protein [Streptomyces alanosinicus]|uniref:Uncharacterized protein n=1 Tax=Streptomyces alanosinicus TaxID=68171 RepID=A0A918YKG5_9ACTN|nr:hypothetical protein [Streptomyces alanosinicus]GHE06240.1 hypothetical protein GCM10010339_45610 [Streptomyces alanosinicus]
MKSGGGTGWHDISLPVDGTVPNRHLSGFAVDPHDAEHIFLAVNGFSRHWTEGPGAGVGHVFESTDGGTLYAAAHGRGICTIKVRELR